MDDLVRVRMFFFQSSRVRNFFPKYISSRIYENRTIGLPGAPHTLN